MHCNVAELKAASAVWYGGQARFVETPIQNHQPEFSDMCGGNHVKKLFVLKFAGCHPAVYSSFAVQGLVKLAFDMSRRKATWEVGGTHDCQCVFCFLSFTERELTTMRV